MMSEEAPIRIVDCESDDEKGNHTDINSEDLKTIDDNNWLNDKVGFYKLYNSRDFTASCSFQVMLKYLSLLQSEVAKVSITSQICIFTHLF